MDSEFLSIALIKFFIFPVTLLRLHDYDRPT